MDRDPSVAHQPVAIVLLSGGMDSTVCLAHAIEDNFVPAALHVNYGQRTQARELQAFTDVCDHYKVEQRLVVDISHLAAIGGSSLTDNSLSIPELPNSSIPEFPNSQIPNTYVPFRNANILAIATSWAEVIGAEALYIGAVEEDSSGYPDCTESFFTAFQAVINAGTKPETQISIKTPVIHHRKADIVGDAQRMQAPLHLSWSCYRSSDTACGKCDSCLLRLRGFRGAGVEDPVPYTTPMDR